MFRPRIIPILLLRNGGLIKTVKFGKSTYIGDPINAVKIFNDLKVDEIVLLDIDATKENRTISIDLVKEIGEEANMPFSVGGGIKDIETIKKITQAGAERVILNSWAIENPELIKEASNYFGSSTICVCIDYKKSFFGKLGVYKESGEKNISKDVLTVAKEMEEAGAGEIILQSIERDGAMGGYDLKLLKQVADSVKIPTIALGGAGSISDLEDGHNLSNACGLAAGSFFVFKGEHRGVLIQYPPISNYNFKR